MSFFTEIVNMISIIIWEEKTVCGWPISSRQKGNAWTFTTPDFKPQHRVIVTKTTWQGHQIRHGDQGNLRGFSSKVTQLQPPNFNKKGKITHWRKIASSKMVLRNRRPTCRRIKLDTDLSHSPKSTTRRSKILRLKGLKMFKENTSRCGQGKNSLNRTPVEQEIILTIHNYSSWN